MKRKFATKRMGALALATMMATSNIQVFAASDISGHWAEDVLKEWSEAGLLSGFPDGTLRPNDTVTRAQFVMMIQNAMGLTGGSDVDFTDVKSGDWFYDAVAVAVANGVAAGFPDGSFAPNDTVTRAQAAVFGANALKNTSGGSISGYTDSANIPSWAADAIGAMTEKGYLSGMTDGSFAPNDPLTRAQAVSFLDRVRKDNGTSNNTTSNATNHNVTASGTTFDNQTFEGNVTISASVGDGEVYFNDVVIKGDLIVNGGGDDSIYLTDTKVEGKIIMNYKGVRVSMDGNSSASTVQFNEAGNLASADSYTGKVTTITIPSAISTVNKITIDVPADNLIVDGRCSIDLRQSIGTITVNTNAASSYITTTSNVKIDKFVANAKVDIQGKCDIGTLEANASGITYASTIDVDSINTATGVTAPTCKTTSSSGSSSSGSSSNNNWWNSGSSSGGGSSTPSNPSDPTDPEEPDYGELPSNYAVSVLNKVNGTGSNSSGSINLTEGDFADLTVSINDLPEGGTYAWDISGETVTDLEDTSEDDAKTLNAAVGSAGESGTITVTYSGYELTEDMIEEGIKESVTATVNYSVAFKNTGEVVSNFEDLAEQLKDGAEVITFDGSFVAGSEVAVGTYDELSFVGNVLTLSPTAESTTINTNGALLSNALEVVIDTDKEINFKDEAVSMEQVATAMSASTQKGFNKVTVKQVKKLGIGLAVGTMYIEKPEANTEIGAIVIESTGEYTGGVDTLTVVAGSTVESIAVTGTDAEIGTLTVKPGSTTEGSETYTTIGGIFADASGVIADVTIGENVVGTDDSAVAIAETTDGAIGTGGTGVAISSPIEITGDVSGDILIENVDADITVTGDFTIASIEIADSAYDKDYTSGLDTVAKTVSITIDGTAEIGTITAAAAFDITDDGSSSVAEVVLQAPAASGVDGNNVGLNAVIDIAVTEAVTVETNGAVIATGTSTVIPVITLDSTVTDIIVDISENATNSNTIGEIAVTTPGDVSISFVVPDLKSDSGEAIVGAYEIPTITAPNKESITVEAFKSVADAEDSDVEGVELEDLVVVKYMDAVAEVKVDGDEVTDFDFGYGTTATLTITTDSVNLDPGYSIYYTIDGTSDIVSWVDGTTTLKDTTAKVYDEAIEIDETQTIKFVVAVSGLDSSTTTKAESSMPSNETTLEFTVAAADYSEYTPALAAAKALAELTADERADQYDATADWTALATAITNAENEDNLKTQAAIDDQTSALTDAVNAIKALVLDKTDLVAVVAEVDAILESNTYEDDYTADSRKAFEDAVAIAKALGETSQDDIDTKVATYEDAIDLLDEDTDGGSGEDTPSKDAGVEVAYTTGSALNLGKVGDLTTDTVTLTLENAKFSKAITNAEVTLWFTSLGDDIASVTGNAAADATSITLTVTAKSTVAATDDTLAFTIPVTDITRVDEVSEALSGTIDYEVAAADIVEEGKAVATVEVTSTTDADNNDKITVGDTLTAVAKDGTGAEIATGVTYDWYYTENSTLAVDSTEVGSSATTQWVKITFASGADETTYTIDSPVSAKARIKVVATGSDTATTSKNSAIVDIESAKIDLASVTISGAETAGQSLTAVVAPDAPTGTLTYKWEVSSDNSDWTENFTNETGDTTETLVGIVEGKFYKVTVTQAFADTVAGDKGTSTSPIEKTDTTGAIAAAPTSASAITVTEATTERTDFDTATVEFVLNGGVTEFKLTETDTLAQASDAGATAYGSIDSIGTLDVSTSATGGATTVEVTDLTDAAGSGALYLAIKHTVVGDSTPTNDVVTYDIIALDGTKVAVDDFVLTATSTNETEAGDDDGTITITNHPSTFDFDDYEIAKYDDANSKWGAFEEVLTGDFDNGTISDLAAGKYKVRLVTGNDADSVSTTEEITIEAGEVLPTADDVEATSATVTRTGYATATVKFTLSDDITGYKLVDGSDTVTDSDEYDLVSEYGTQNTGATEANSGEVTIEVTGLTAATASDDLYLAVEYTDEKDTETYAITQLSSAAVNETLAAVSVGKFTLAGTATAETVDDAADGKITITNHVSANTSVGDYQISVKDSNTWDAIEEDDFTADDGTDGDIIGGLAAGTYLVRIGDDTNSVSDDIVVEGVVVEDATELPEIAITNTTTTPAITNVVVDGEELTVSIDTTLSDPNSLVKVGDGESTVVITDYAIAWEVASSADADDADWETITATGISSDGATYTIDLENDEYDVDDKTIQVGDYIRAAITESAEIVTDSVDTAPTYSYSAPIQVGVVLTAVDSTADGDDAIVTASEFVWNDDGTIGYVNADFATAAGNEDTFFEIVAVAGADVTASNAVAALGDAVYDAIGAAITNVATANEVDEYGTATGFVAVDVTKAVGYVDTDADAIDKVYLVLSQNGTVTVTEIANPNTADTAFEAQAVLTGAKVEITAIKTSETTPGDDDAISSDLTDSDDSASGTDGIIVIAAADSGVGTIGVADAVVEVPFLTLTASGTNDEDATTFVYVIKAAADAETDEEEVLTTGTVVGDDDKILLSSNKSGNDTDVVYIVGYNATHGISELYTLTVTYNTGFTVASLNSVATEVIFDETTGEPVVFTNQSTSAATDQGIDVPLFTAISSPIKDEVTLPDEFEFDNSDSVATENDNVDSGMEVAPEVETTSDAE